MISDRGYMLLENTRILVTMTIIIIIIKYIIKRIMMPCCKTDNLK
jgi:hypothetical protein